MLFGDRPLLIHDDHPIHELDLDYLKATRQVFVELNAKYGWQRIECALGSGIKPIEEIHQLVWENDAHWVSLRRRIGDFGSAVPWRRAVIGR